MLHVFVRVIYYKVIIMKYFSVVLLMCLLSVGCKRVVSTPDGGMGIPIQLAKPNYPIDVFFENQVVDHPYTNLGVVKLDKEVPLNPQQTKGGRMLYRGNDEEQKKALLDQLILQAIGKGAHAIVNVKYKYYTGKDYQGFIIEGMAVKYTNKDTP